MYYYIKGTVAHIGMGLVVIDAGGVGYAISTSLTSASDVKVGGQATFYTHLNVREDAMELYGFSRADELACFRQLISVSGVGPKAALAILGTVRPDRLALCVVSGDEKALTMAPGVGKKLAQRIILELKDKMASPGGDAAADGGAALISPETAAGPVSEAIAALQVLGYPRADAVAAVRGADAAAMTADEIVRYALKRLF